MTHEQKLESATEIAVRWVSDRKSGEAPSFTRVIKKQRNREAAELRTREAERAAPRTRQEQKEALIRHLQAGATELSGVGAEWVAERHIAEAEARGAAEQRRKDAEDAEPVAYRWAYDVPKGRDSLWHFGGDLPEPRPERTEPKHVTPLYARPVNVAALEARVKGLEVASREYLEAQDIMQSKGILGASKDDFLRRNKARDELRAAAIREGGK